jgi:hypothetical protein
LCGQLRVICGSFCLRIRLVDRVRRVERISEGMGMIEWISERILVRVDN